MLPCYARSTTHPLYRPPPPLARGARRILPTLQLSPYSSPAGTPPAAVVPYTPALRLAPGGASARSVSVPRFCPPGRQNPILKGKNRLTAPTAYPAPAGARSRAMPSSSSSSPGHALPPSRGGYPAAPAGERRLPRAHVHRPTLHPRSLPLRGHRLRRRPAMGKSRRSTAYPQQIVTTRLLYCLQDRFAQLSRLQRI
jgi:hypothetical protein